MRKYIVLAVFLIFPGLASADTPQAIPAPPLEPEKAEKLQSPKVRQAIDLYKQQVEQKGQVKPETSYNVGSALHDLGEYKDALDALNRAVASQNPALEANAYYNLGNTHFRMQEFDKAVQNYQESLKRDPMDPDAKINLELALKQLQQQQQQQQQDQKKKEQDESKESEQDKEQQGDQNDQKKDDQQQQDQSQQNQQQQDQQNPQQKRQKQQSQQSKAMSREDAIRLLNAIRDDEQDIQKRIRREQVDADYQGKDW